MLISASKPWIKLKQLQKRMEKVRLDDLFLHDKRRAEKYSLTAANVYLDYSKNLIDSEILEQLFLLLQEAKLNEKITQLSNGELINHTEQKAAHHPELRKPLDCANPMIVKSRERIKNFVNAVYSGEILGISGKKFTDVVNIGIGGSDLGPKLACEALQAEKVNGIQFHFLSNVDDSVWIQLINKLNPETTLFILASKSFSTVETLLNFEIVKKWLELNLKDTKAWQKHFIAVTAKPEAAVQAGFQNHFIFPFWDSVGGRYSLWSSVGLSVALCIGYDNFERFLSGAHKMDEHFQSAPFTENMPVILALMEIWYTNFWKAESQAVIPYTSKLNLLPSYLQQLVMESNGKAVNSDGQRVNYSTGSIIWGGAGTNCQHSFMQLLHQTQYLIPVDFIALLTTEGEKEPHQQLLANCFSQSRVLMIGKNLQEAERELLSAGTKMDFAKRLAPHKVLIGNKPSNTLLLESMSPESLGALISAYEHKVFVSAMVWDINPFDQWGVEMGKVVAKSLLSKMQNHEEKLEYDNSTNQLIKLYRDKNNDPT